MNPPSNPLPIAARDTAIDRLIGVFQQRGYQAASLSELSSATGLGRSSLYHHFPDGKADMARAVLARVSDWLTADVLAVLEGPGEPRARLAQAIAALDAFYQAGRTRCVLGNFVLDGSREVFAEELRTIFTRLIAGFARVASDAGLSAEQADAKAEESVVQLQGALVLASGMGDAAVFQRALWRLPSVLLSA